MPDIVKVRDGDGVVSYRRKYNSALTRPIKLEKPEPRPEPTVSADKSTHVLTPTPPTIPKGIPPSRAALEGKDSHSADTSAPAVLTPTPPARPKGLSASIAALQRQGSDRGFAGEVVPPRKSIPSRGR